MNAVHPICIKNQYENNNILGVDASELRFGSVQNLVLQLETRPRTEPFRIHPHTQLRSATDVHFDEHLHWVSITSPVTSAPGYNEQISLHQNN